MEVIGPKVIVSFTTLPHRIRYMKPMIMSMAKQISKPDQFILWLPEASWKTGEKIDWVIPRFIRLNNLIDLRYGKDLGPLTKIAHVLSLPGAPEDIIVTADDDIMYPQLWLAELIASAEKFPDCAVGFRAAEFIGKGFRYTDMKSYGEIEVPGQKIFEPKKVDILTGVYGVAYRRRFFDVRELTDFSCCPSAYFNDDIWISGLLAKHKIDRICVPYTGRMRWVRRFAKVKRLWDINQAASHNDIIIDFFKKYWKAE